MTERTKFNECYSCINKRSVLGNAHIRCAEPDPEMEGHHHGIKEGWFYYPQLFDPTWKLRMCNNYKVKKEAP